MAGTKLQNYLVTGGSGFIGTHLISCLLSSANVGRVHILDIKPPQVSDPRVLFHACDIRQPIKIKLSSTCDVCFHLAALCKEPSYPWDDYFVTNHIGTIHVRDFLEQNGVENLVFTSTMMVFRSGEQKKTEYSLAAPDTAYGMSKLLAEVELQRWAERFPSRRLRIVRPGVVFGHG